MTFIIIYYIFELIPKNKFTLIKKLVIQSFAKFTFTDDLTLVPNSVILAQVSEIDAIVTIQSVSGVTG